MPEPTPPPPLPLALRLYDKLVLSGPMPWLITLAFIAVAAFLGFYIQDFQMDATPDSIVLESDKDLQYYDSSRLVFGADEYIVLLFQMPSAEAMVSEKFIGIGKEISEAVRKVKNVESVLSFVDVPLFHSPDIPLPQLASKGYNTLLTPGTDLALAKDEILANPFYRDYLVSMDASTGVVTTAVMVTFDPDREMLKADRERTDLREKKRASGLNAEERGRLAEAELEWDRRHVAYTRARQESIREIRKLQQDLMRRYPELGAVHQSGFTMIIADMVDFIRHDIIVFGAGVVLFMILTLSAIFRSARWVALLISTCLITGISMVGYLGYSHWLTTVVSSNFSSLLLILTLSSSVHVLEHYRELHSEHPGLTQKELVLRNIRYVFVPISFMVLTTAVGFASLMLSGIRPVMDFGVMMAIGMVVSLASTLVFMPAVMALLPRGIAPPPPPEHPETSKRINFANFTAQHRGGLALMMALALAVCAAGVAKLNVEMRFLDYFSPETEICQGMTLIDEKMGGTMPLEIVLEGDGTKDYWLAPDNLAKLKTIHDYVDSLPDTGKVISMDTLREILQRVNKGREVNRGLINMALKALPEDMRRVILDPYVTRDFSKARIVARVKESDRNLKRSELRGKIERYLDEEAKVKVGEKSRITGYFVLYENMIRSLYRSQISTVSTVFLACFITFTIVFRSLRLALIGLAPNVLSVTIILGSMGWMGIHLDMMTIMIAAVTFGMADDNTIHYIVRFKEEFKVDGDYVAAMFRCHNTVGKALSYSMVAVVAGFAILGLSDFVPTVYFGLFTAVAMFVSLLAVHTVLPTLILFFKPFGKGKGGSEAAKENS